MYNNIGLQTARGSGTNGFVQANLANLLFSKNKVEYNAEEDIAKAEADVNKAPNAELLDHEYKRAIEIKCAEFEDLMEGKGFNEEEIKTKVNEYRKLLFNEFESGSLNMESHLDLKNSHTRAKVAKENRERMRYALGIDAAFVDGSSLEKLKKASEKLLKELPQKDKETMDKEMEKSMMQKLYEKIKEARERKKIRGENSSSSSSSTMSTSSDEDSSSGSSSSSSSDTSVEQRMKAKGRKRNAATELQMKKEIKEEPMSERQHFTERRTVMNYIEESVKDRVTKKYQSPVRDRRNQRLGERDQEKSPVYQKSRSPRRHRSPLSPPTEKEHRRRRSRNPIDEKRRKSSKERRQSRDHGRKRCEESERQKHRSTSRDRRDTNERSKRRRSRSHDRSEERNIRRKH